VRGVGRTSLSCARGTWPTRLATSAATPPAMVSQMLSGTSTSPSSAYGGYSPHQLGQLTQCIDTGYRGVLQPS
jgi:hypothetical protein